MTNRGTASPSPLMNAALHLSGSLLAFAVTLSAGAGLIHFFGDEDAAAPTLRMALFLSEEHESPDLTNRPFLKDGGGSAQPPGNRSTEADVAEQLNLAHLSDVAGEGGLSAGTVLSVASAEQPSESVRINGREVLPGQALSDVRENPSLNSDVSMQGTAVSVETPFERHARVFDNPEGQPTVSIIVGGLGINWARSMSAIEELPPEVTLSFAPTAPNLPAWIRRARAAGHEVLIELPMEPYDYGRARAHPQLLRSDATDSQNMRNLRILLARGSGYTGVINFQGDKFATQPDAITPILEHLSSEGLAFYLDGNLAGSGLETAMRVPGLRFGHAATAIDARPEAAEIETQLLLLEAEALEQGASLGTAMPFPITVDLLNDWFERLDQQGILLAPASHFARQESESGQIEVARLDPQG